MDHTVLLEGRQALPLPFDDSAVRELTLRDCLTAAPPADRLSLLAEARRILLPGGVLHLTVPRPDDDGAIRHLARQLGMSPLMDEPGVPATPGAEPMVQLRKPDRRASGSPLVTLSIPAYAPRFFELSLASAVAQTYANLEIIVCDDSADTRIEEITRRQARVREVRYERNARRLRGRGNYARCFALSSGEFIKFLNDDDVLLPDCVERMVDAFRLAPDIVLATSYRLRIDESGAALPDQPATRPLVDRDMILNGVSLANVMLMAGLNVVGEPTTTLFRKVDLEQAIPGEFRFESADCIGVIDMAMWSALLLKGDAVYFHEALSHFRIHADQQQHDPALRQATVAAIRNLQANWLRLGLHARSKPDQILGKSFPAANDPWQSHPFAPLRLLPAGRMWWT